MGILHSDDYEGRADFEIPTGWQAAGGGTSPWLVRDVPSIAANGTKVLTSPGSSLGTPAEFVGVADGTKRRYEFRQKAAIDGANLYIIGVAHTDHLIGNPSDFNYRFLFTATTSSVTANISPFIDGGYPGNLGTGNRAMATAAGDNIGVAVEVDGKTASVWVWNDSHESQPVPPLATWTDTVQRAAGHFGVYWMNGGVVLLGLDQLVISDGVVEGGGGSTSVTIAGSTQHNAASSAAAYQAVAGVGTLTTGPLKNNTGTVYASTPGWTLDIFDAVTGAFIVRKTGLTASSLGVLTVSDALLVTGVTYAYEPQHATYKRVLPIAEAT